MPRRCSPARIQIKAEQEIATGLMIPVRNTMKEACSILRNNKTDEKENISIIVNKSIN